jgi:hypothetical protein
MCHVATLIAGHIFWMQHLTNSPGQRLVLSLRVPALIVWNIFS